MISCLCPTSNRFPQSAHLLEEAVESFARQDRPKESELVILNDAPGQTLVCDVPDVRVVNLPFRMPNLGAKFNLLVELSRGDILLPWEDDDISLPMRINQAVARLGDKSYWKPPQVFFLDHCGLHIHHNVGVRHHASVFTREAWKKVGGYPLVSGNQDAIMDHLLGGRFLPAYPSGLQPSEWQYIYCWGRSDFHLSGHQNLELAWKEYGNRPIAKGVFKIEPKWHRDYGSMVRLALTT